MPRTLIRIRYPVHLRIPTSWYTSPIHMPDRCCTRAPYTCPTSLYTCPVHLSNVVVHVPRTLVRRRCTRAPYTCPTLLYTALTLQNNPCTLVCTPLKKFASHTDRVQCHVSSAVCLHLVHELPPLILLIYLG